MCKGEGGKCRDTDTTITLQRWRTCARAHGHHPIGGHAHYCRFGAGARLCEGSVSSSMAAWNGWAADLGVDES